jgi:hypothetical protein
MSSTSHVEQVPAAGEASLPEFVAEHADCCRCRRDHSSVVQARPDILSRTARALPLRTGAFRYLARGTGGDSYRRLLLTVYKSRATSYRLSIGNIMPHSEPELLRVGADVVGDGQRAERDIGDVLV